MKKKPKLANEPESSSQPDLNNSDVKKMKARQKRAEVFATYPIWKSMLMMGWPSILMTLVMGLYFFSDSILSAQFAGDSYPPVTFNTISLAGSDQVRMFMNSFGPMNALIVAFAMLFAMGISTRVSINLGRKDVDRAKRTIRSGVMMNQIIGIILIPILIFITKPWIRSQFDGPFAEVVATNGFSYGWIIIACLPLTFFNSAMTSLFRAEARNRQSVIASVLPVGINLFLDWVFMGPGKMGVEGSAWATFIATSVTTVLFLIFIIKDRAHSIITLQEMFGRFKFLPLFGIILVGIAPFFRNVAQSITQTVEMKILSDIFTNDITIVKAKLAGVMPIFGLFFPLLFGVANAGSPIAAFNYGAKNYKRVKTTYFWSTIFAFGLGSFNYLFGAVILGKPLLMALGTQEALINDSLRMLRIVMTANFVFGFAISGMMLLSSTDKLLTSLIASNLRGIIVYFPVVFTFRFLAMEFSNYSDLFWWMYPTASLITSIVVVIMSFYTIKHLDKRNKTLDERIDIFTMHVNNWKAKRSAKKNTKPN